MEQPLGCVAQWDSYRLVCCFHKSLYGLKLGLKILTMLFNSLAWLVAW